MCLQIFISSSIAPFHVNYLCISPLLPTPLMMVFPSLLICEGTLNEARQEEQKPSREPHREINRENIREVRKRERQRDQSRIHKNLLLDFMCQF